MQHFLDAAVEPLDHTVGLRRFRRGPAVLDAQFGAERVELVLARRGTFAQAEQAIRELLAVVGQDGADADRAGALQVKQEAPRIGRSLGLKMRMKTQRVARSMATNR